MADEPRIAGFGNGAHDGRVVDLLGLVQVVATGVAGRVEVPYVADVVPDGPDQVAFHDLHVIDVVEQLDPRRADTLADGHAPLGAVALIVRVVHLAVEELHGQRDALLLGGLRDAQQPFDAVVASLLVGLALPIAREADQAGDAVLDRHVHVGEQFVLDAVVVFRLVQAVGQGGVPHHDGDVHARVADPVPVLPRQHFHGCVADPRRFTDQRFGCNAVSLETAEADGLADRIHELLLVSGSFRWSFGRA